MNPVSRFVQKLTILFSRNRYRSELNEEMAFHRAQAEKEFIKDGMAAADAKIAAKRQFGNATLLNEQSHEVVGFRAETVAQDLRFTLRQLRKNPGFALTAISILALGMGVSVAIFGFVDAALLEPLPYADPNRLMSVDETSANFPRSNLSRADYEDWKRLNRSFSSIDVYTGTGFLMHGPSGTVPVPAARVSGGFFQTLGIKPFLGRLLGSGEDKPGGAKIVVLSYGTWMKRFGANSNVVGQSVNLSGDNYTIVGVLPREFAFAPRGSAELWTPLLDKTGCESRRSCHNLDGIGRLRDGVTRQAALADLKAIAAHLERQYSGSNQGQGVSLLPISEIIVGDVKNILLTLLCGAGLLLVIACVNVASLLLVRSESRKREIAVRGALGATPIRLMRQFITEGLLLAAAGCAGGFVVADWLMIAMTRMIPGDVASHVPFLAGVGINVHTGAFAGAIALMAAVLLAATPMLRLGFQDLRDGLAEGGRGAAGRLWRRMGANLVVVELAVAVVLLVGAGLLGRSLYRLLHVEMGFDTTHLATVQVMAPANLYGKDAQKVALYREITRRLSALPGVQSVGITSVLPANCNCNTDWIRLVGKPFHGEHNEVNERDITPDFLPTLKARLIRGRLMSEDDDAAKPQVIVINEALERKYYPDEDPIGKKIGDGSLDSSSLRQIVGVVADVREGALDQDIWPAEYQSIYFGPDSEFSVAMRTQLDEKSMLPVMVSTLHQVDPNLGIHDEISLTDQINTSQSALLHRYSTWLVGGFAVVALVLGVVGLYGVIAFSVSQRTREIGVRMALGAQRGTVYKLVMRQAGWLTLTGLGFGLACSLGTSMLMRKLLFGVQAWDATTLAGVAIVLGTASLIASFLPAHRAACVSPTDALRAE